MAYVTGTAANLSELVTLIRNACVANGWTLAGGVLYKGNTYVEIVLDGTVGVRIKGGTGIDGSDNLTGGCPEAAFLGTIGGIALAYPMNVEVHINTNPDEVFVIANYTVDYYSMMAWGISDVPGLTGSGVWFYANRTSLQGDQNYRISAGGTTTQTNFGTHLDGTGMFCLTDLSGNGVNNSFIHADVDSGAWHTAKSTIQPASFASIAPLLAYLPNAWNQETILLPYPVYVPRTSGSKHTLVADLKHIRHTRIDFHEPGDIITLGPDKWKLYPWFRKDTTARDAGGGLTHSGTIGYAVRYTGP